MVRCSDVISPIFFCGRRSDAAGDRLDLVHDGHRPLERGGIGESYIDEEIAFVLVRDETGRNAGEADVGEVEKSSINGQHDDAAAEEHPDDSGVDVGRLRKTKIKKLEEPAEGEVEQPS